MAYLSSTFTKMLRRLLSASVFSCLATALVVERALRKASVFVGAACMSKMPGKLDSTGKRRFVCCLRRVSCSSLYVIMRDVLNDRHASSTSETISCGEIALFYGISMLP